MSSRSKRAKPKVVPETRNIEEGLDVIIAPPNEVDPEIAAREIHAEEEKISSEPPGRIVYVSGSKFSHPFRTQAARDFQAGKVKEAMQIQLPDGQIITSGPTYETHMCEALLKMIKGGIVQASNFGKLAKRRG
jgi:hypothetical protein